MYNLLLISMTSKHEGSILLFFNKLAMQHPVQCSNDEKAYTTILLKDSKFDTRQQKHLHFSQKKKSNVQVIQFKEMHSILTCAIYHKLHVQAQFKGPLTTHRPFSTWIKLSLLSFFSPYLQFFLWSLVSWFLVQQPKEEWMASQLRENVYNRVHHEKYAVVFVASFYEQKAKYHQNNVKNNYMKQKSLQRNHLLSSQNKQLQKTSRHPMFMANIITNINANTKHKKKQQ